jgi:hypothetical protein
MTVARLGDDLDPVVECHTKNEFVYAASSSLKTIASAVLLSIGSCGGAQGLDRSAAMQ